MQLGVKVRELMRRGIVVINSRWRIGTAGVIILAFCATIVLWHGYKTTTQSQDRDGDVNAIRAKAELGDVQAEFRLGSIYGSGNGAPKDYSLALRWYLAAAEKGDSKSEYGVGYLYNTGKGVQQNFSEALRWYQKAADQNNPRAQDAIGDAFYDGKGVERDWTKAALWYRRAAENGLPQAQYDLGYMLYYGQGLTQNRSGAIRWFREALKRGDERTREWLGYKLTTARMVFLVIQTLFGMALAFRPWSMNIWEPNRDPRNTSAWVSISAGWTCLIDAGIGWWGYTHNLFWNWSYGWTGFMLCKAILNVIVGILLVAVLVINQKKVAPDSEIPVVLSE